MQKTLPGTGTQQTKPVKTYFVTWSIMDILLYRPTHRPIFLTTTDVLDIALIQSTVLQYSIQNVNDLPSDHNPIILDISNPNSRIELPRNDRYLIN